MLQMFHIIGMLHLKDEAFAKTLLSYEENADKNRT